MTIWNALPWLMLLVVTALLSYQLGKRGSSLLSPSELLEQVLKHKENHQLRTDLWAGNEAYKAGKKRPPALKPSDELVLTKIAEEAANLVPKKT